MNISDSTSSNFAHVERIMNIMHHQSQIGYFTLFEGNLQIKVGQHHYEEGMVKTAKDHSNSPVEWYDSAVGLFKTAVG